MLRKSLETQLDQYIRSGNDIFLKSLEKTMMDADKAGLFRKKDLDYFLFLPFKLNYNKQLAEKIVIALLNIAKKLSKPTLHKIFTNYIKGFLNPIAKIGQSAQVLDHYLSLVIYHANASQGHLHHTFSDNLFFKTIVKFVPADKQKKLVDVYFSHLVATVKLSPHLFCTFLKAIDEATTAELISPKEAQHLLNQGFGATISSKEDLEAVVKKQKELFLDSERMGSKNRRQLSDSADAHVASISDRIFLATPADEKDSSVTLSKSKVKTTFLDLRATPPQSLSGVKTTTLVLEEKKRQDPDSLQQTENSISATVENASEFNARHYQQFGLLRKLRPEAVMNYLVRGQDDRRSIDAPQLQRSQSFTYGSSG
jgi:hypothetical protein